MRHWEFIAKLRAAGYQRAWMVQATYDDGCAGAGTICAYTRQGETILVQDCGEVEYTTYVQRAPAQVAL